MWENWGEMGENWGKWGQKVKKREKTWKSVENRDSALVPAVGDLSVMLVSTVIPGKCGKMWENVGKQGRPRESMAKCGKPGKNMETWTIPQPVFFWVTSLSPSPEVPITALGKGIYSG